ncbi:MAG: hypothetical protein Q9199_007809 [Rusavskia elegans]
MRDTPKPLEETIPSLSMAPGDPSNPASEDSAQAATRVRSGSNASETSNASLQASFGMVIHIPNEPSANRLCCLDTIADMNVISQEATENLALKTESYRWGPINPIGRAIIPERQITFDWHVHGFYKTYTSTFVVLDRTSSDEFDTLIGRHTAQKIVLFPDRGEGNYGAIQALFDESLPFNIISRGMLAQLGVKYTICREIAVKDAQGAEHVPMGKVDLRWQKEGLPISYKEPFRVVDKNNSFVILGASAFPNTIIADEDEGSEAPSLTMGSTASVGSFGEVPGGEEELAELFLKDDVLQPLYRKALEVVKVSDFEKKFRGLLKACANELRKEASSPTQQNVSRFLQARVRRVVSHIGTRLDPEKRRKTIQIEALAFQKPDRRRRLDADLHEPDAMSESGSSDEEALVNSYLYHLEHVKGFISNSEALANLRGKFRRFVLQSHVEVRSLTDADIIIPPTPDSPGSTKIDIPYKSDNASSGRLLMDILRNCSSVWFSQCVRSMLRVAKFLELREKPIGSGLKRVRWICVSNASSYLKHGVDARDENRQSPGLRRRRHSATNVTPSPSNSIWVLPIFYKERYMRKVEHLSVNINLSDLELFGLIKKSYYLSKSMTWRLLAMRGVKKVSFVKFMHAPWAPDIQEGNCWPTKERCPPWDYEGCRTENMPNIGEDYLLHRWRNPSHSDEVTYFSQPRSLVERVRFYVRSLKNGIAKHAAGIPMAVINRQQQGSGTEPVHDEEAPPGNEPLNHGNSNPIAPGLQIPDPSRYIFLRTPKMFGKQLIPDDKDTPEAWGLYFEEGFLLHHLFLIILCIYIMATAAFAAYWCTKYGFVGPESGTASFAVSSWMIGLISLVFMVMFKWAE